MLELRGIEICNAWFSTFLISKPYEETESAFEKHVAFLAAMGAKVVGVSEQSYSTQGIQTQPVFEGKYEMNDGEWELLCQGLNRLGKLSLEKYGVTLTFHHHMGTVVQTAAETDRLMAGTDPAYVNLLFDSGHFAYCGEDPVAMVTKHAKRIRHVHLKDIRPDVVARVRSERLSFLEGVRQGAFTIPGDGCVAFDPIFRVLADSNYEGYMVVEAEQDPAKANPLEYAIRARKFIREHSGL
jgi:inosose dehydratase